MQSTKTLIVVFLMLLFPFCEILAQQETQAQKMKKLVKENFEIAAAQYKILMANTPSDKAPRSFKDGKWITSSTDWWTSGFVPGSLWYIYEQTKDTAIKRLAEDRLKIQEPIKRYTGNHDIGFMIFCSFGNAYRITGDRKYKDVIDTAAEYQLVRFKPTIHSFQSWNTSNKYTCPAIIDNMMNLEQLCWVSKQSGNNKYIDIAKDHANTTLKNHFRNDYSSYHVVDYDVATGNVLKKVTHQGLADSSAWARGQAWGLYGFTVMYRFTKDEKYLQQANRIANFILKHPHMPKDLIPYWDFDAPVTDTTYRDVSAGSIIASALLELAKYNNAATKAFYVSSATKMLMNLSATNYRAKTGENGGYILKHSVGSLPHNSEVDVPLTYADYYFLEALKRYKDWYL